MGGGREEGREGSRVLKRLSTGEKNVKEDSIFSVLF